MAICKFYQSGNCKNGANCRFEHPGYNGGQSSAGPRGGGGGQQRGGGRFDALSSFQNAANASNNQNQNSNTFGRSQQQNVSSMFGGSRNNNNQNNFSNSIDNRVSNGQNQNRGGFGGGRRGGFQGGNRGGRGGGARNNGPRTIEVRIPYGGHKGRGGHIEPRTTHITSTLMIEDLKERPQWLASCYSPNPEWPKQLFEGESTEQSPEEIRVMFELAKANNTPQEYIQIEQQIAAEANQRQQNVLENLDEAMDYLDQAKNDRPNRWTHILENNPKGRDANVFAISNNSANGQQQQQQQQQGGTFAVQQQSNTMGFGAQNGISNNAFSGTPTPAFGQPAFAQPGLAGGQQTQGAFAVPSINGTGFGQAAQPAAFGQVAPTVTMNDAPPATPAFGQQPQQPFGQPSAPSAFGQAGFGTSGVTNGVFGQQPQTQPQAQAMSSGFGTLAGANGFNVPTSTTPQPQAPQPFANGANSQPQVINAANATRGPDGRLTSWNGRPVRYTDDGIPCYQRQDGQVERIWFPDGAPANGGSPAGDTNLTDQMKQDYGQLKSTGAFANGMIPTEPPTGDLVDWDL